MKMQVALAVTLITATAFGQAGKQTEEEKQVALADEQLALMKNPANLQTEAFEAESDEYKVRVYRLLLNVPEKKPRKAGWVAVNYRVQVTYHVATSERREAFTEAILLGADAMEAMKIDREHYEAEGNIAGKPTAIKVRYLAGTKLVASQDVLAIDTAQANKIINRIHRLDEWARLKSGN